MTKRWVAYRGLKNVKADDAAKELQRIESKHGGIRPAAVVSESRAKSAPLHSCFEWDDKKAGDAYRINQARELIRCVRFIDDSVPASQRMATPGWFNVARSTPEIDGEPQFERVYVSAESLTATPDLFASALSLLMAEIDSAKRAVAALHGLAQKQPKVRARVGRVSKAIATAQAHAERIQG